MQFQIVYTLLKIWHIRMFNHNQDNFKIESALLSSKYVNRMSYNQLKLNSIILILIFDFAILLNLE